MNESPQPFTEAELQEELEHVRHPGFFGKLLFKIFGGKITDVEITQHKKPRARKE